MAAAPPRVLLIIGDQWERALIRASLREVGYDAVGARNPAEARRYRPIEPGRGAIGLIVADHEAAADREALNDMVASHRDPPVILLARSTSETPKGAWTRVIHRPLSVADLVAAVESLLPLPPDARHPLDDVSS
jgi:hypothetical protein